MSQRLLRSELADRDLREIVLYLLEDTGEATALRFLDAVDATFTLLEQQPKIGRIYSPENPRLGDLRAWRVRRFDRYLVFYRVLEDTVRVERVLHGSRDVWTLLGLGD